MSDSQQPVHGTPEPSCQTHSFWSEVSGWVEWIPREIVDVTHVETLLRERWPHPATRQLDGRERRNRNEKTSGSSWYNRLGFA